MDIDTMVENHFKKNRDLFGFEAIVRMIEEVMDEWGIERPLLTEQEGSSPRSETFTFDLIPTIPISELGWGQLKTPDKGGDPVDPKSRNQLAQYLKNIGGDNLQQKLIELNAFMNEDFVAKGDSPAAQLRQTISYLIFYKTLTSIITSFNASAAGFAFESFLAVLLDAKGGKQIPASGKEGSTIADIILTSKEGLPISLKLYAEKTLKVGGSYKQLVEDLTGGYPLMQYVAVTKKIDGDGPEAKVDLGFNAFNFTKDNFLQILASKPKEWELLRIPALFMEPTPTLENALQGGDLEDRLTLPSRTFVDLEPVVLQFKTTMEQQMLAAEFDETVIEEFTKWFEEIVDPKTGVYAGTKDDRFTYGSFKGLRSMDQALGLDREEKKIHRQLLSKAFAEAQQARSKKGGAGKARSAAFKNLDYRTKKQSVKRLLQLQKEASPELFKVVMENTLGYTTNKQFDLSKKDLGNLATIENQTNLFPYGDKLHVGDLKLGAQRIQDVLDRSVNEFNKTIFKIFDDLRTLSTSLNAYVADGLQDPGEAQKAEKAATDIASGTKEVAGDAAGGGEQLELFEWTIEE